MTKLKKEFAALLAKSRKARGIETEQPKKKTK